MDEVASVFGEGGVLARRLEGFRVRTGQVRMATEVAAKFEAGGSLLVEAPTGIGKSLAYLAPAILGPVAAGRRVVVSTHTIALQEQLLEKELPLLGASLPIEFSAQKALGRTNYLGIRRMEQALAAAPLLAADDPQVASLRRILAWSRSSLEGRRVELDPAPLGSTWEEVQSESDNCLGRRCQHYGDCFFQAARRRLETANIIVTNHALLVLDGALRELDMGILPDYDDLIVDEAHQLPLIAADHLGLELSRAQVQRLLTRLKGRGRRPGVLQRLLGDRAPEWADSLAMLQSRATAFFDEVDGWREVYPGGNGRYRDPHFVDDLLSAPLKQLGQRLQIAAEATDRPEVAVELQAQANRAIMMGDAAEALLEMSREQSVYWVESAPEAGRTVIHGRPLDVSEALHRTLFAARKSVVLTSATLSPDRSDSGMQRFARSMGLERSKAVVLDSPFDLSAQVRALAGQGLPLPGEPGHMEALCEWIEAAVTATGGGAFVLFTSYASLDGAYRRLLQPLERAGRVVLRQTSQGDRAGMLRRFREDGNAVLFGTESFWEGVDVPGPALRLVIVTRLPFPVPTTPLNEARAENARRKGIDSFRDIFMPAAMVRFRQGFGRLIRTEDDEGWFLCLDSRLTLRAYGRRFQSALGVGEWEKLEDVRGLTSVRGEEPGLSSER